MRAFTDTPITKDRFIHHLKWHQKQDAFIKGIYSSNEYDTFKGCAVGCSLNSVAIELGESIDKSEHALYEKYLGIPEWLARVEDTIYEGLPDDRAKLWPIEFGEAINIGSDLNKIKSSFIVYVLESNLKRLQDGKFEQQKEAVKRCIRLWQRDDLYSDKWRTERSAARSAAESAAWSAAESAAWSAAESAARSAESAAESAAWSAAYVKFADKLLELIRECE